MQCWEKGPKAAQMQLDERRCSADVVLGERTKSSTDVEGALVQMQQWQW